MLKSQELQKRNDELEKQLRECGDAINTIQLLKEQLEEKDSALAAALAEISQLQQMVKNEQGENLQLTAKVADLRT
jgi:chromosome segregation ATPase